MRSTGGRISIDTEAADDSVCCQALRFEAGFEDAERIEAELDAALADVNMEYDYATQTVAFVFLSPTRTEAETRARELQADLARWTGKPNWPMTLQPVTREDWSESWKRHFHAVRVSRRFVIKPSWEETAPEPGAMTIEMDPGMSFGTGRHFTTQSCLRFLDESVPVPRAGGFLDVGCGSGILSVAANKLGYRRVFAFDNDPLAVRIARENLARNGVAIHDAPTDASHSHSCLAPVPATPAFVPKLRRGTPGPSVVCRTLDLAADAIPGRYGTVVANMLANALTAHAPAIAGAVDRSDEGGWLILAGTLTGQYPAIKALYEGLGFAETHTLSDGEWQSGCFRAAIKN